MKQITVIIVVLAAAMAGTVVWMTVRASAPRHLPNIILISIDTCRPDHFGCYGHTAGLTPNIDAFAKDGVLFTNAITPVPLTFPAHASMLTGTIPPYHGVHDNIAYRLAEKNVTLAEHLSSQGYTTAGVVAAFVLDKQFGISQGFDTYNDELDDDMTFTGGYAERPGGDITQAALDWLDQPRTDPFFLFLHYFDPHHPYRPPEPFAERFSDDPYGGEIAYTDHCIGQVLDKLRAMGLYDSSVIIVAGDHGEAFGEHNESEHGYYIYHTTTRVPLIVKTPDSIAGHTVAGKVSIVDITPTILSIVGDTVPSIMQGVDLTPWLRGGGGGLDASERHVFSESMTATKYGCSSLLGIENDRWKYIQTTAPELYDLSADPGELNNVANANPRQVGQMRERLRSLLEETLRASDDANKLTMDAESLERLRQLGYTGGPVVENFEFSTDLQDPKEFIGVYFKLERLDYLVEMKHYVQGRKLCREVLAKRPDIAYVHGKLGRMAVEQGRGEQAIVHFREALRLSPDSALWHNNLGALLVRQGQLDEAARHFSEALRLGLAVGDNGLDIDRTLANQGLADSPVFNAYMNLGSTLMKQGNFENAADMFRQAVKTDADNADAYYLLGLALRNLRKMDEAMASFREAVRLNPDHAGAARAWQALQPRPSGTP